MIVRGALIAVELDPTVGREQQGIRPCIVVSDPDVIRDQRFPLVCVVPITGTPGEGDKRRVRRVVGELAREEMAAIDEGLAIFLGLSQRPHLPGAPPGQ